MTKHHSFMIRLIVFVLVLLFISLGSWAWWRDGIAAVNVQDNKSVIFEITTGESGRTISTRLAQQNLVRSPTSFFILLKVLGIEKQIQAGEFRLNKSMNAEQIALALTHGTEDIWVTTLEGWRLEEIAAKLSKEMDIPEREFLAVAREGYMFPDTYLIPKDATAGAVVEIFIRNFDKKVPKELQEEAKKQGLTFDEVLTLASIVEREGKTDQDRPMIAGVLLKRLKADWPLQADATLQYVLGYQTGTQTWWRKDITNADKKIKSPYNTYSQTGLPPGPIGNPGLSAIKAVINPTDNPYWYYIHDPNGVVHYAKTVEEHNDNVAKYLQ